MEVGVVKFFCNSSFPPKLYGECRLLPFPVTLFLAHIGLIVTEHTSFNQLTFKEFLLNMFLNPM